MQNIATKIRVFELWFFEFAQNPQKYNRFFTWIFHTHRSALGNVNNVKVSYLLVFVVNVVIFLYLFSLENC